MALRLEILEALGRAAPPGQLRRQPRLLVPSEFQGAQLAVEAQRGQVLLQEAQVAT